MTEDEKELAETLERTRGDEGEWSDERIDIGVAPTRSQVVSFRLPLEELELLSDAAEARGESLSQFVRRAIDLRLNRTLEPTSSITGYVSVLLAPPQQRNEPDPSRAWGAIVKEGVGA